MKAPKRRSRLKHEDQEALSQVEHVREIIKSNGLKSMEHIPAGSWGMLYDPKTDQFFRIEQGMIDGISGLGGGRALPVELALLLAVRKIYDGKYLTIGQLHSFEELQRTNPVAFAEEVRKAGEWHAFHKKQRAELDKKMARGKELRRRGYR